MNEKEGSGEIPEKVNSLRHPEVRAEILKRLPQSELENVIVEVDAIVQANPDMLPEGEEILSDAARALGRQDEFLDDLHRWEQPE
jgi:lipopolysaccharide biosynthesis regulator YciM